MSEKPRTSIWFWNPNTVQRLLTEDGAPLAVDELHVRRLTKALNSLDNQTRYRERRFRSHEIPCDPWHLDCA